MSEPDDVERLVDRIEAEARAEVADPEDVVSGEEILRLARIVRELLAELDTGPCVRDRVDCIEAGRLLCRACRARALRERLCRIARGEEA